VLSVACKKGDKKRKTPRSCAELGADRQTKMRKGSIRIYTVSTGGKD
jgi:hypothetical protein